MSSRANDMRATETHLLYINEVTVPGASGRIGITFSPARRKRVSQVPRRQPTVCAGTHVRWLHAYPTA